MNKSLLLRIHRWITLVFALPLAVLILTGLVLSFEPIVGGDAIGSGPITTEAVANALAAHDPDGKARAVFLRAYDGTLSIQGAQRGAMLHVDIASNARVAAPGTLAGVFSTSRRLHETLLFDLGWLVTAATAAMLVLVVLGVLMGWPRLRNSVSSWHKGTAWVLLPLVVVSPLTGLLMSFGISLSAPPPSQQTASVRLAEAVQVIAAAGHDLSAVSWVRQRGSTWLTRLDDGGEMRVFAVAPDGLTAVPRNWPRLVHEGNWGGIVSAAINIVTSTALILLFATGLFLWGRRKLRQPRAEPRKARAV